ncbi:carboxymuconolactone decarboxylase family protein [Alicyclobacillus dauci]|uniref:Carboxymuconolactone decarboxylase family protein n=1 Tax=Alicyclobacillus dauci TaxID=1475485 RepID=A0ABY6Z6D8_9BACL|nr:carboxymuconolactone decarboxylase family protein [Alicyclobacillus dauci]WAH38446.1 carboxymuconolactone decarboxylase family protein [Alicyclobacillus dauci]
MEQRISGPKVAPEAYKIMYQFEKYTKTIGFDPKMMELIKIRASQINGCAFCLDMHARDARAIGETEQRIYCLNAWRESPFYNDVERVALELTETITLIATNRVSDDLYNRVRQHFDEKQYVDLIFLINTINSWNRLSISMNLVPGDH